MARQLFGFEAPRGRGSAFDQTKTTTKQGTPRLKPFGSRTPVKQVKTFVPPVTRPPAVGRVTSPQSRQPGGFSGGSSGGGSRTTNPRAGEIQARLAELRGERLQAALAAIAAQFDVGEGELNARRRLLGSQFDLGIRGLDRLRDETADTIGEDAADRGILRSGIYAQDLAQGLGDVAVQRADLVGRLNTAEGAEGTEIRDITSAIELLAQQEESALASAEVDAESEELTTELMRILAEAGLA